MRAKSNADLDVWLVLGFYEPNSDLFWKLKMRDHICDGSVMVVSLQDL